MTELAPHMLTQTSTIYRQFFIDSLVVLMDDFGEKDTRDPEVMSLVETIVERILWGMSRPERHYHTNEHLSQMTMDVVLFHKQNNMDMRSVECSELIVATGFHDIIYDAKANDNEERSVNMMRVMLTGLVSGECLFELTRLVMATKWHQPVGDLEAIICDADLAGLGTEWFNFSRNSNLIEKEFSHLERDVFLGGRKAFFEGMLSRDTIYHTETFRALYEETARYNMRRSIDDINSELGGMLDKSVAGETVAGKLADEFVSEVKSQLGLDDALAKYLVDCGVTAGSDKGITITDAFKAGFNAAVEAVITTEEVEKIVSDALGGDEGNG